MLHDIIAGHRTPSPETYGKLVIALKAPIGSGTVVKSVQIGGRRAAAVAESAAK
jgi:hypothetical protein